MCSKNTAKHDNETAGNTWLKIYSSTRVIQISTSNFVRNHCLLITGTLFEIIIANGLQVLFFTKEALLILRKINGWLNIGTTILRNGLK